MFARFLNSKNNRLVTVSDQKRLPVTTTIPEDITLAENTTQAGSKTYEAETSKTLTLEFYGSVEGATATLTFQLIGKSGKAKPFEGIRQTAPKDIVTSGKLGETVSFSVPAGFTLQINYTAPSSGTLSIKGTVE